MPVLRGRTTEDVGIYSKWALCAADAIAGVEWSIIYGYTSIAEARAFMEGAGRDVVDRRR